MELRPAGAKSRTSTQAAMVWIGVHCRTMARAGEDRIYFFLGLGLAASLRFFRHVPSLFRSRGAVPPPGIFTCGTLPALRSAM